MKLNQNKLEKLLKEFQKIRSRLLSWRPSPERTNLNLEADDIEGEILDLLHEAKLSRFETKDFTISLRNLPTFFKITSKVRLISALQRHHLTRFLIPDYSIDLQNLKEYLLANKTSLPGLSKIENKKSLYIFRKYSEDPEEQEEFLEQVLPELFVVHGIDPKLAHPEEYWRQAWFDLRLLANVAYPRLKKGKKWGTWTLPEVRKYFAQIVDALRSVYFPILEKEDDQSTWWDLYRESRELMKSKPPKLEDVPEWDKKRKEVIQMSEDYAGLYLVEPHGLLLYQGDKTAILKSVEFTSHVHQPLYLISGAWCYGVIELGDPSEIENEVAFKATYDQHHVSEEERLSWWPGKWPLFLYSVRFVEKFDEPKRVKIPHGIQTFVKKSNISFL